MEIKRVRGDGRRHDRDGFASDRHRDAGEPVTQRIVVAESERVRRGTVALDPAVAQLVVDVDGDNARAGGPSGSVTPPDVDAAPRRRPGADARTVAVRPVIA